MPCTDVNISHIPASYIENSSHKINNSVMTNLTLALIDTFPVRIVTKTWVKVMQVSKVLARFSAIQL